MLLNFNEMKEITVSEMNGGSGTISAKMYADMDGKIIACIIPAGSSLGLHKHQTSDDINFVLSGTGTAICDGKEENLFAGGLPYLQKGIRAQHYK